MNIFKLAFSCLLLVCLTACVTSDEEIPLAGKTYRIIDSSGNRAHISFNKDKTVNGFSGVNRFFGKFKTAGDHIMLYEMGSTRMAGPADAMKFEDKFMNSLSKTNRFFEIGRNLTLFNGEMPVLILKLTEKND